MANTNPGYVTGQIPSAARWNLTYTEKVDGTNGVLTDGVLNGGTFNGNIGGSPTLAGLWTFAAAAAFSTTISVAGAAGFNGAVTMTAAGTALDITNNARTRGVQTIGVSPNNTLTVTPGATTADPVVLNPSGAGGVRFTSAGPVKTAFTDFGQGGTYTVSGSAIDPLKFSVYARNNLSGVSTADTLPAVAYVTCASANVACTTTLVGTLVANMVTGGALASAGGWHAAIFDLNDGTSATNDKVAGTRGTQVAVQIARRATKNQGGTSLTVNGGFGENWGMNIVNGAFSGATFLAFQCGLEINQQVNTGASVYRRADLQLSSNGNHVGRGVFDDGIVVLRAAGGATLRQGLVFGGPLSGTSSLGTDSKLLVLGLAQDRTATADVGVDFGDATFTTSALKLPGATTGGADFLPTGTLRIGAGFVTPISTGVAIDTPASVGTGTPTVNAGGSGFASALVDFDDAYGGVYTCNVNVGTGAVTSVATVVRQPTYPTTSPPATLALTARVPSVGTGAILNGSWDSTRIGLSIQPTAGGKLGFNGATPIVKPTGVAITAAGIHAALVSLGLIAA